MEAAASPRFVRRILMRHGLLLVLVLAVVGLASGAIYDSTRQQVLDQAKSRQLQLADQTVRGIANYYQTIFENLDLVRRAENEETNAATERATDQPTERTEQRPVESARPISPDQPQHFPRPPRGGFTGGAPMGGGAGLAGSLSPAQRSYVSVRLSQILWRQLQGRVASLFWFDRAAQQQEEPPPHPQSGMEPGAPPPRRPGEMEPGAPPRRRDNVQQVGRLEGAPSGEEVIARNAAWLASVKEPSVSPLQKFANLGDEFGGAGGANVIAIPYPGDRLLVAVVPIRPVQDKFLRTLNDQLRTDALLIDPSLTVLAASRPTADGANLRDISDLGARHMAIDSVMHAENGTQIRMSSFEIGRAHFAPSLVSAGSLQVADKNWELLIASPISSVDEMVATLLHRALLWGAFLVLSVVCVLASTAWQLIRARTRLERERHQVLTRELDQARQIQLAWLPAHPPSRNRAGNGASADITHQPLPDVAAINIPANHISGDFYNWFELSDGRLVVTVGDVTGHGMSAAFLMATTQLLVRNTLTRVGDPGRCLSEVNDQLCVQVFNGQFVTMLILVLDLAKGELEIAAAGHPAPLLADGESFQPLPIDTQLVLGVEHGSVFTTQRCPLPRGSSLLLYTDGVVDCLGASGRRFGAEDLRRALYGRYDNAQAMLSAVANRLKDFRGDCELTDDLTLVAIQLPPEMPAAPASTHGSPRQATLQP